MSSRSDVGARLLSELRHAGLHTVLRALNERTRFRFTGLYRADKSASHNVALFDRENPALTLHSSLGSPRGCSCAPVVGLATCRASIELRDSHGQVPGTLCHFDYRPRVLSDAERSILERVAPLLLCHVVLPIAFDSMSPS